MGCPDCGVDVAENQKFCHECGGALSAPEPPPTEPIDAIADRTPTTDELPTTQPIEHTPPSAQQLETQPIAETQPQLETQPIAETQPPQEQPLTEPPDVAAIAETPTDAVVVTGAGSDPTSEAVTEPMGLTAPTASTAAGSALTAAAATDEANTAETTAEMPTIFDGSDDLVEYPVQREPFRVRMIFILSLFGTMAVLMSIAADVIDIRTTRPVSGIVTGSRTLEDIGSNLTLAAFAGAAVMLLGSLLACFGLRWGAGLAGGAGLALLGWAGLTIGLAEFPIAVAESITRTSPEPFVLRVTRDLGWWLIVGVGVLGAIVFIASLRSIGTGGRPALNPLIAAVTAVAAVILGFGPLVPVGNATFEDNFRSTDPNQDLPTAFFAGRLGQVALIAVIGAIGMLLVRSYGLGLAAGAVSVASVMWITSLVELGDRPIGIADRNPGALTTVPHGVTTFAMVATLILLAIAAGFATYRLNRGGREPAET